MTDSSASPLVRLASHVLRVATDGPGFFASVVPAMALAQALGAMLLAQGGERAVQSVAQSEEQLTRVEAYWPEHQGRNGA